MRKTTMMLIVLWAVVTFSFCNVAQAHNFCSALGVATSNIPAGADAAGIGNTWVANSDFSSNNPAVIGIIPNDFHASLVPTYGLIHFEKGPDINLYSVSATAKLPVGAMQVTYSNGGSGLSGTMDEFTSMKFNSFPSVDVQYGFKAKENLFTTSDKLYLGVGYAYGESKAQVRTAAIAEEEVPASSALLKSKSHSVSAGAVYSPVKNINLGVTYKHYWEESKMSVAGDKKKSHGHTDLFRAGASVQITETTMVAVDYQHLNIDGTRFDQWFAGVEQYIVKDTVAVYGGWAADGPTAGVGVYFKNGGVNVSYMDRPMKDAEEYLGKARVVMASLYLTF